MRSKFTKKKKIQTNDFTLTVFTFIETIVIFTKNIITIIKNDLSIKKQKNASNVKRGVF